MDQVEIFILNRYAASELAGAVILGKMARKADDPYLRRQLTWHCAEEARHAVVWEELIHKLGVTSIAIHDDKKKGYFSFVSEIKDSIDFLSFVHVYELRVPFHFTMHAQWTKSKEIKEVLQQLIKEEGSHLSWIRDFLQEKMKEDKEKVLTSLKKFSVIEEKTYNEDLAILVSLGGSDFVKLVRDALPQYKGVFDHGVFK